MVRSGVPAATAAHRDEADHRGGRAEGAGHQAGRGRLNAARAASVPSITNTTAAMVAQASSCPPRSAHKPSPVSATPHAADGRRYGGHGRPAISDNAPTQIAPAMAARQP